jgi:acyl dehydratase
MFRHTPTGAEFELFARVSGDDNPIHIDPLFSARTRFGRPVAHGMMLYALMWGAVRSARPGRRIAEQRLMFPNPAFAGETLVFEGRIEQLDDRDCIAVAAAREATGEIVCDARFFFLEGGVS